MSGPTKLVLWFGVALALIASGLPNEIFFSLGLADIRMGPSHEAIAIGLCCIVGALSYWSGYQAGQRDEQWNERERNRGKNSN